MLTILYNKTVGDTEHNKGTTRRQLKYMTRNDMKQNNLLMKNRYDLENKTIFGAIVI